MKFSTKEDIEAPIKAVFDMLTDFESFERSAMRRGAHIRRVDHLSEPGVGMTWQSSFALRGKQRDMQIAMVTFEHPTKMVLESVSSGINATISLELAALSRSRTRILVALDITPQNLSARLLMQSVKLAKTSLTQKYKLHVAEYAKAIEDRYTRAA